MSRTLVVILNWNGREHLRTFLSSVVRHTPAGVGIVVADNGSDDDSVAMLQRDFPNTCYTFDPPRQTLSPSLVPDTLANTFTTIMGDDLFPRFSAQTYINLQDDIVTGLCRCKKTKLELFWCLLPWSHPTLQDLFYSDDSQIPAEKALYEKNWKQAVEI